MAYSAEKPNILLIISDDQGYGDFGFMGNTILRTPQLDKLAASAAIFENYTTGVACSPARSMLYTGRNHLSTGVWGVGARFGLRRDETLLPMFFRENGYSTFYLGKGDSVAQHRMSPHYAGWQESLFVGGYKHYNARLYHTPLAPLYSIKPVDVKGWTSEFMTERGIEFMKEKKGSPWLLTMPYIIPHMPWKPVDERYAPYYRDKGCSATIAACFSHIEQMDTCVGQLLDALRETGQDENTIVIFVSDNGQTGMSLKKVKSKDGRIDHPDWAIRNVAGLRGAKSTAWENGTRVPLLVRMPGTIPAGMRSQFVTAEDVLPTLLDVAGISQDSVAHKPFSGVSVRSALLDEKAKIEHPEVFRITSWGEHSLTGKEGYIPDPTAMKLEDYHAVLRGPEFKLEMVPGGKVSLYDIVNDRAESKDISKKYPEVTARMLAECRRQFSALIDDGAFRFSTIYIGDKHAKNRGGRTFFDSAARIQSHTGDIRIYPKLNGFAKEGDSVTYTIESAAAGTYAIQFDGTFAGAAPLRVEVAGKTLPKQELKGNKLSFGSVELPEGEFPLKLIAGKPAGKAKKAAINEIVLTKM
jgi:arylsulfatase A-like enzyme